MAPAEGGAFGRLVLADLSVAPHFANLRWARHSIDAARWPKTAARVARVEAAEPMAGIRAAANQALRLKLGEQRPVLEAAGCEVVAESIGGPTARRGPLSAL